MKIVFLILASQDEVHQADQMTQVSTWASDDLENIKIFWLHGWKKEEYYLDGRNLYVPCEEDYSNILEKTILGAKYLLRNFEFDLLIRSNVSSYFNLDLLQRELSKGYYRQDFFGGYVDRSNGKYFKRSKPFEYVSGTGIFVSRRYLEQLSQLDSSIYTDVPDDVAITDFLNNQGFRLVRMKRCNLSSTHLFFPCFQTRAKSSTDSELAGKRMTQIHSFVFSF